ncbi:glycosyltransferase family 4 protein [Gryllotalpicola reticulitermitis]|uniref:Glycosyltransferase family 4 protein n=1 Tax=Gryllotalpicola reticulitermitis TaxID=1184153 RepID=A0ABV8QA54_9MICO
MTRALWFLVPAAIDDPAQVSGGNVYDQRLREGLARLGWRVRTLPVAGAAEAQAALSAIPPGELVLVDGLVAGWASSEISAVASRMRLVVLAHMVAAAFPDTGPDTARAEREVLAAADLVIATSEWTAGELVRRELVAANAVAVVRPGTSRAADADKPGAPRTDAELLCVGVIAPHKGHDVLMSALRRLPRHDWRCTLAGSTTAVPEFAERIAQSAARFDGRIRMPGVLAPPELDRAYRRAGVLVAPSLVESFGMAIADARRRGMPVIASDAGGIRESAAGGGVVLVPPRDPEALAHALWRWLSVPADRVRLQSAAASARNAVPDWSDTVARVDRILGAL